MKRTILVFSKYSGLRASSRLRTYQYLPFLEQHNYDIEVSCLYDDDYLLTYSGTKKPSLQKILKCYYLRLKKLLSSKQYDIIYIEKELFPFLPAFCERLLYLFSIKYIVDYDDAVFHNYDSSKNFIIRLFLSKKIDAVMKASGLVIVGNHYLCDRAMHSGAREIRTLPTVIDASKYSLKIRHSCRTPLTIGWIGSPHTQKYLMAIADDLCALSRQMDIQLKCIGANEQLLPYFHGLKVAIIPWSEETEVENIQTFDIGIMPLPDEKYEHGKCRYPLIQYMACGIPVVASNIGVTKDIITDSQCGLLVDDMPWDEAIVQMVSDHSRFQQYSRNAKKAVKTIYSMQVQQHRLLTIFNEL